MSGIMNKTGAVSGILGTTVGTPAGGVDGITSSANTLGIETIPDKIIRAHTAIIVHLIFT